MTDGAKGALLCRLSEIADPGARGFVFGEGVERREVFVVRHDGCVRGYRNACPHAGTPLETWPDRFLTNDNTLILCTTHGARFRIEDGFCVSGPCKGERLQPVAIMVEDGEVRLSEAV